MHDKGKRPLAALQLRRLAPLARRFAVGRRPGQREHVEVERSGLVLAPVLRRRRAGRKDDREDRKRRTRKQLDHGTPPNSWLSGWSIAQAAEHFKNKMEVFRAVLS